MKRREFVKSSVITAGALGLAGKFVYAQERKPNVLLIIVDQWRQRRWFPESARLPGYERLCREGLEFTNFFTSAVPCSPSRACLFTGLHITQHNVQSNVNFGMNPDLDPGIPTLGHRFKDAGYQTPYFGKWHLSGMKKTAREKLDAYGFTDWVPPDHHGTPYDGLLHDPIFTDQAIHWLRKNGKKEPWFLTLSLVNPHDICYYRRLDVPPLVVPDVFEHLPENFNDDLNDKPRIQKIYRDAMGKLLGTGPNQPEQVWLKYLDFYYYLIRKVDEQVARILAELDRLGLSENTIVIFTADHGEMCGSHKLQAKGPFVYQENNNVPFVIRWSGKIPAGTKTEALGQNPDLFPTLLELVGINADTGYLPGKSLAPVIFSRKQDVHQYILMAMGMNLRDPNAGGMGIIGSLARTLGVNTGGAPAQIRAIFDGRYKFARYFDEGLEEEYELYDLKNDPLEMHNLARDTSYAVIMKEMADRLKEAEQKEMERIASDDWKIKS